MADVDQNLAGCKVNPMPALAWALGASVVLNIAIGVAYLDQRDTAAKATEQRDAARAEAQACSAATDALQTLADKRQRDATTARAAAAKSARTHNQRADSTLARQPKDPSNSCASIQALGDDWLQGRNK